MNEFKWAKGIKHLFQGDRNKADFNQFIAEVIDKFKIFLDHNSFHHFVSNQISNENFERMAFQVVLRSFIENRNL